MELNDLQKKKLIEVYKRENNIKESINTIEEWFFDVEANADKINFKSLSKNTLFIFLPFELIKKFEDELDWNSICTEIDLSEKYAMKFNEIY